MAVSIHDVAREASLSCETILEGLISPSSLEPEVVRFVMETIRKTGYLETFARWKTGKQSTGIAVLTFGFDSASDAEAFKGVDRVLSALGLDATTVVFPTRHSPALREDLLSTLLRFNMVSAVITMNLSPSREIVETYARVGKPLVLMQTSVPGGQSVLLENQKGMSIAVNYLYQRGYRRIALLNGPTSGRDKAAVPAERLLGYVNAMQRVGLELDESLVFESADFDTEDGIAGFRHFDSLGKLPDAVLCATGDMSAIGFVNAAREAGLRVPEDIAVMGYDDLPVARLVQPGLTTIRQRLMIAGAGALVLALESAVNGKGRDLVIMPELVERGSA